LTKANSNWTPQESFGGLVLETAALLKKVTAQALGKSKSKAISFSRVGLLNVLETEMTLAELSVLLRVQPPSLLELLTKVRREGLIESRPSPDDKRKVLWKRTGKGTRALGNARKVLRNVGGMIDRFFSENEISESELDQIKRVLIPSR
jgi:DNA-binding MarR family transcriptional regulator